jgi:hypothetical protein
MSSLVYVLPLLLRYQIQHRTATLRRIAQDAVFDCRMANDPATINKESTNENNTDVDRWVDARRLRINGKPCS